MTDKLAPDQLKIHTLLNRTFGTLKVLKLLPNRKVQVHCEACGKNKTVDKRGLYRMKSCGCLRSHLIGIGHLKHGAKRAGQPTPEYTTWVNIINRTENAKPGSEDYRLYRGRGIKLCRHFRKSFPAFLAEVGNKPNAALSIDRIDTERGYLCSLCCPPHGNLRWASAHTQRINQRRMLQAA
jgi:hypothetical protein